MINQITRQELEAIARKAGDAIMTIYNARNFNERIAVQAKGDDSPLTQADLAAHNIIVEGLEKLSDRTLAGLPILSEESAVTPWEVRNTWEMYWLVDPLDGTKEFIKRNGEFTVNIALVSDGIPIAGVVYAPAINTLYVGIEGRGAWKNNQPIPTMPDHSKDDKERILRVVGSRSHHSPEMQQYLDSLNQPYELIPMGSSLKLCLVAEGAADLYPRLGLTSEWDTAAAHAVVIAAGGSVTTISSGNLIYNRKESLLNPSFICFSHSVKRPPT